MRINGMALRRGIIEPGDALELGDVRFKFVGAGQFFRPATGARIASGAIPFSRAAMPGAATTTTMSTRPGMRRWLVGGAIVGLVVVAGFLLIPTEPGDSSLAEPPVAESDSEARGVLKDALKYGEDDLDLAHKLLKRIPEDSPVRNEDGFREIEDRWAQATIAKALGSKDKDEATRLLNEVAYTDTVSTERRYQAIDILEDMGVTELPSLPVARPRKSSKSSAREDIYDAIDRKPKRPSKPPPRDEDVYDDLPSTRPPPPRDDVYDDSPPARRPRRPRRPATTDDPYD
jgi:hypothetical protein